MNGTQYGFFTTPPIGLRMDGLEADNAINGRARIVGEAPNMWASDPKAPLPQWVELRWDGPQEINVVYLTFDTDLNPRWATIPFPPQCVRDYDVSVQDGKEWRVVVKARGAISNAGWSTVFFRRCLRRKFLVAPVVFRRCLWRKISGCARGFSAMSVAKILWVLRLFFGAVCGENVRLAGGRRDGSYGAFGGSGEGGD